MTRVKLIAASLVFFFGTGFGYEANFPLLLQKRTDTAIEVLRTYRGHSSSSLHQKIFGAPVDGRVYLTYLKNRIRLLRFDYHEKECGKDTYACSENYTVWLSPETPSSTDQVPMVLRQMILIHEARHSENIRDGWIHEACPRPFPEDPASAGEAECDYVVKGAYGVEYIFAKNLVNYCDNCGSKIKADAKIYAEIALDRVIGRAKSVLLNDY